jgi:hypothetical protein
MSCGEALIDVLDPLKPDINWPNPNVSNLPDNRPQAPSVLHL